MKPTMNLEEIGTMNIWFTSKEVKSVITNLPEKKSSRPVVSLVII